MCFFGKWLFLHVFCVDQHRLLVPVMARQMDQSLYSGVEVIVCNSMWLKLGHQEHLSTCWIGCCPMYKLLNKTNDIFKNKQTELGNESPFYFFFFKWCHYRTALSSLWGCGGYKPWTIWNNKLVLMESLPLKNKANT